MNNEVLKKINNFNVNGSMTINEDMLKNNYQILQQKLDFWKKNTHIKFNNQGRCEIDTDDDDFKDFIKKEIYEEFSRNNEFVCEYLNKAILFFTNNVEEYILNFSINERVYTCVNSSIFYKQIKHLLLDNPMIDIKFEEYLENSKYNVFNKKKTQIVKKSIKLSKILDKMNSFMSDGEKEYNDLMKEKKSGDRSKSDIEIDLFKYKDSNPYWIQQKYLPYKNRNLIISINPLDIFTCSGIKEDLTDCGFNLTKFNTCYSTSFSYNEKNDLKISPFGEYSNPCNLYKLNSFLSKGIIFIPNGNTLKYGNHTFFGMAARCHMYLVNNKNIYCETAYPSKNLYFSSILNNIFKSVNFFDRDDIERDTISKNIYYIASNYEEEIISDLSYPNLYLDNVRLLPDRNRYVILKSAGEDIFNSYSAIAKIECPDCLIEHEVVLIDNDMEIKSSLDLFECLCREDLD